MTTAKALYEMWLRWPEVAAEQATNGPHPSWDALSADGKARWQEMARVARPAELAELSARIDRLERRIFLQ